MIYCVRKFNTKTEKKKNEKNQQSSSGRIPKCRPSKHLFLYLYIRTRVIYYQRNYTCEARLYVYTKNKNGFSGILHVWEERLCTEIVDSTVHYWAVGNGRMIKDERWRHKKRLKKNVYWNNVYSLVMWSILVSRCYILCAYLQERIRVQS